MMMLAIIATTAFCKLASPTALTYAPDMLSPSLLPPTDANYLAAGWLRNAVSAATNRVGYTARLDHYEAHGAAVYAVYEYVPIPWTPRRFFRYDVSQACYEEGFLDQLMAYIKADPYIQWFWNCSNEVEEGNPLFVDATNRVVQSGVDEVVVRRILDRAYALGTNTTSEVMK